MVCITNSCLLAVLAARATVLTRRLAALARSLAGNLAGRAATGHLIFLTQIFATPGASDEI